MRVFLSCGEPSGRLLAGLLEAELVRHEPGCRFVRSPLSSMDSTFGFWEGARSVFSIRRLLDESVESLTESRADVVVLVAFPGVNLPFGVRCRRLGVPVVYLAPPQVWAWGWWRVGALRRAADMVVCLFPFEERVLQGARVPAVFTGYPLVDIIAGRGGRAGVPAQLGPGKTDRYVVFLPGSRPGEVRFHEPLFARVACELANPPFGVRGVMLRHGEVEGTALLREAIGRYSVIAHAECAVVVSGTATLETALLGTPQVACYHLSPATRLLARRLVRTRWFTLPNILLSEGTIPEVLEPTVERLLDHLRVLLGEPDRRARARHDAERLQGMLGPPGALGRIARLILEVAGRRPDDELRRTLIR